MERMDHFFTTNGIDDADKKKSTFLAVIGPATYSLLRNLVSPSKPGGKSYSDIVATPKNHFNLTPSEMVQHSKFLGNLEK